MSVLAMLGGEPIRAPRKPWPSWPPLDGADERVAEVVRSGVWSFDGPREWEFCQKFADFGRARYCLTVANGTIALQLALEALDIGAYDEVIVPGLTWQATAAACLDVNAVPILVDIDPETYCLDVNKAEAAITPRTKAIIVVHLYGAMADMDGLATLCKRRNLYLIEDCAHQHGSRWNGRGVGTLGQIGAFSLQQSKVLTAGEGGINSTDDWDLFQKLYSLRNCGRAYQAGSPTLQSGNYRITEMQAALLLAQMEHLEERVERRDANARYLSAKLAQIPGLRAMKRYPQITRQSYYCYSFRYDPQAWDGVPGAVVRAALQAELGLGVGTTYEPLNACALYQPHTKRRYRLSEEHWKAIDPTRFELPACHRAFVDEAMVLGHRVLLAEKADMDQIAAALGKLYEQRAALRSAAKA